MYSTIGKFIFYNFMVFLALLNISSLQAQKFHMDILGKLSIDTKNKTIEALEDVRIQFSNYIFTAQRIKALYLNLDNLRQNLSNQSLGNFTRIEAIGQVNLQFQDGVLTGDEYVYDVKQETMVLRSRNENTTYKGRDIIIDAMDRFEYQEKENIVIARGKPIIRITQDASDEGNTNNYTIYTSLLVSKLSNEVNDIEYIEAFDGVRIVSSDKSVIKGNYAYYNRKDNQMSIEDNVSISKDGSILEGCKIIVDLETAETLLIPCSGQSNFSTTISTKSDKLSESK